MNDPHDQPTPPNAEHLAAASEGPDIVDLRARVQARIDDYQLLNCLGRGGMGAVFRAHHLRLDRPVAIKVLLPAPEAADRWEERFLREARALARLAHPGIVTVYDYGKADDLCWIVMEYVDGANLRELMLDGKLKPEEALAVIPQVCAALQYAHDRGVVHRDLKPENVLLDESGAVHIADFGLAKLMDAGASAQLTHTDQAMGTLRYMAPEQLERPKEVDHRADIFSLGVVFYEMLTGQVPAGSVQPPSAQGCSDVRLDEVVMRSMEREPEERYQRAEEVGQRLEELRDEKAPRTRAGATPETGAHAIRGRLRLASLVVAGVAVVTLLGDWGREFGWGSRGYQNPMGLLTAATLLAIGITNGVLWDHRRGFTAAFCQLAFAPLVVFWPMAQVVNAYTDSQKVLPMATAGLGGLLFVLAVLQLALRDSGEGSLREELARSWAWVVRGVRVARFDVGYAVAIAIPALGLFLMTTTNPGQKFLTQDTSDGLMLIVGFALSTVAALVSRHRSWRPYACLCQVGLGLFIAALGIANHATVFAVVGGASAIVAAVRGLLPRASPAPDPDLRMRNRGAIRQLDAPGARPAEVTFP